MGTACNCSKSTDGVKDVVALSTPGRPTISEGPGSELAVYERENATQMHKKILELYKSALVQNPPGLTSLKLNTLKAKDKDWVHIFTLLQHSEQLQRLHLWKVTISGKSLDQLGDSLMGLKRLEYLMIGDMSLASLDLTHLRDGLKGLESLKELIMTVNYLNGDHLAILLPGLVMLKRLEFLSLDENELGNKGVGMVVALLESLKRLRDVSLKFNSVSRKGLMAILPWITRRRGLVVRLDGNDLNDDEYDQLEQAHLEAAA